MIVIPVALAPRSLASPPIPLVWRGGQLCVPISLMGGKPTWFLLDTGSYRSFLTRKAYARLREAGAAVEEDGTLIATGAAVGDYAVPSLEFAPESDEFQFTVEEAADGYLGMDILAKYTVGLDLREKTLRLWPADAEPDAAVREWFTATDLWTVPVSQRPEGYCVPLDVGNLTVPMVIDTGCPDTFVHTDVAALLKGANRKRGFVEMPFYNGLYRVRSYAVRPVRLGGASLGERTVKAAPVDRMVGLLGRDILSPLKALIDYPRGVATFAGVRVEEPPGKNPPLDGPQVTLINGVVVHWPRDVVVKVPAGATYLSVRGYREVLKKDASLELVPWNGAGEIRDQGRVSGAMAAWP